MQIQEPELLIRNTALDEFFTPTKTVGIKFTCTRNFNCGFPTITTTMSLFEAYQYTDVANDRMEEDQQSNRKLDPQHAKALGQYMLKALLMATVRIKRMKGEHVSERLLEIIEELGVQCYYAIPPLVANLRNLKVEDITPVTDRNGDTVGYKVILDRGDIFWIIDGQHRRYAMRLLFMFLDDVTSTHKYPKGSLYPHPASAKLSMDEINIWNAVKETSKMITVTVESHIGITVDQERQLFHDLNNKGKLIETSLAYKYDTSNPLNAYINETLVKGLLHDAHIKISDKDDVEWEVENPSISRQTLAAINALLFLNKTNIKSALPSDLTAKKKEVGDSFWTNVLLIPSFVDKHHKQKTTAAQPVVLKAMAKLYYDIFFGKSDLNTQENQRLLTEGLHSFDFSHSNPAWRYYMMPAGERVEHKLEGLDTYMPIDDTGKVRDLGTYDGTYFRFARAHNDVYPLIADIMRWYCKLPSRVKTS